MKKILRKTAYWSLPAGLYDMLIQRINKMKQNHYITSVSPLVAQNKKFKNIHSGKRCFIMGNGPTLNTQDLKPLKDEIVFSVSSGYLFKDYVKIRPKYHCTPQFTYSTKFTAEMALDWLEEMDHKVLADEIFFNISEKALIDKADLSKTKSINYLDFGTAWNKDRVAHIDISQKTPLVQSVPVMCLMIAIYMGFSEIYLLGVEHDVFKTDRYNYSFKPTVLKGVMTWVDSKNQNIHPYYNQFRDLSQLWLQYIVLNNIAKSNGISVYNATNGGALDVFERVDLDTVLKKKDGN